MQYAGHSPYGDIFQVNTSAVDKMANRIYAEQQMREQRKLAENKMLDDEFGKNIAGVKSADIPELTSAYNDFKQSHIALQKKRNTTPQDQMDLMLKKARVNEIINASKEDKERIKNRIGEIKTDKKGRYKVDANRTLSQFLNTPTSKRNVEADDDLLYNQYSFPDLAKVTANMIGVKPIEKRLPTGKPSIKGEMYDDENVYQVFNHPNKMYENAFLEISTRPDREAFERVVDDSLSDQEKEALKTRYFAKINSPEFKAIYGEVQPFPESAEKTELGKATALAVMSAVDKLDLTPRIESKVNEGKRMDKKRKEGLEDWLWKNGIVYQQSLNKIAANKQAGMPLDSGVGYPTEEVANKYGEDIETTDTKTGVKSTQRVIFIDKADPNEIDFIRGFVKGKSLGVQPYEIAVTKNGKPTGEIRQGFYYNPGTKDWEGAGGQKISAERVRRDLIDNIVNTKFKVEQNTKQKPKKDPLGLF